MYRFVCFLLLWVVPLSAEIKIGIIGDSISCWEDRGVNYSALLKNYLKVDGYEVRLINYSIAASTTDSALWRLERMIREDKPDIVIIGLGIADYIIFSSTHKTVRDNLVATIQRALSENIQVMLGIVDPFYLGQIYSGKEPFYSFYFKEIYTYLAERYPITSFPFFTIHIAGDPHYHVGDFIHPSIEGHRIIAEIIHYKIKPLLNQIQKKN